MGPQKSIYSRRVKVEDKENKRKAMGFGLLTISIIAFMFYFGLPLLAKVSNFTYDLRKSGEPIESSDKTPPPPPTFNEIPSFTNAENIEISGNTEAGVTVFLMINSKKEEVVTDNSGYFTKKVPLNDGENIFYSYTRDPAGNKSHETPEYLIVFDNDNPDLEVTRPQDGEEFFGSKQKQLTIEGKSEKDTQVWVNNRLVIVGSDGAFSYMIGLDPGENNLTIKAQDQAGNITEKTIIVKYNP